VAGLSSAPDRVAVIGVGLLGRGIARVAAAAGFAVAVFDNDATAAAQTQEGLAADGFNAVTAGSIEEAAAGAAFVVEAILEDLSLKQAVFARLSEAAPRALLLSNSSSLPISDIAARARHPERCAGMHWFNPPELIPVVEVISGSQTSPDAADRAVRFTERLGKIPVRVARDVPGFVGNRLQHSLSREAFGLLSDGIASAEEIDDLVRATIGERLRVCGPLAEIDRLGARVAFEELAQLLPVIYREPHPVSIIRDKVARGELGAKTGRGILMWPPGLRERVAGELNAFLNARVRESERTTAILEPLGTGLSPEKRWMARRLRASLWREAIALVDGGICDAATVDLMAQRTFGLRLPQMGPIQNADFVGLDLTLAVHGRIFPSFDSSPVPSGLLAAKVAASGPAARFTPPEP